LRDVSSFVPWLGTESILCDRAPLLLLDNGLAFARKDNGEVAVGIRPDQIIAYTRTATPLHELGESSGTHRLLARAAKLEPIPQDEMSRLPAERQRIVCYY